MEKKSSQNNLLKVSFLGTGTSQGIPVIGCHCSVCASNDSKDQRLRTSILLSFEDTHLVIDAGPDFRQQMLRVGIEELAAILLTHYHSDHVAGLDDVRPFNFRHFTDMPLYATVEVQEEIKKRFAYIFYESPYPGSPMITFKSISKEQPFEIEGMKILPIEAMHGNLPILGFRIGGFTYLTDVKTISESERQKARNSKVLVLNALHHDEHHSHLNLQEALQLIEDLSPGQAYLIHMSHRMGLHHEVSKILPDHVALAYDGLELYLPQ